MDHKKDFKSLFNVVKNYHENDEVLPHLGINVQHKHLLPELRPYQAQAVQWMIHRERTPPLKNISLEYVLEDDSDHYDDDDEKKLLVTDLPTGGILADEMGLGKTVEVLACILSNPRTDMEFEDDDVDEKPDTAADNFIEKISLLEENPKVKIEPTSEVANEENAAGTSVEIFKVKIEPIDSDKFDSQRYIDDDGVLQLDKMDCDSCTTHEVRTENQKLKLIECLKKKGIDRDSWPLSCRATELGITRKRKRVSSAKEEVLKKILKVSSEPKKKSPKKKKTTTTSKKQKPNVSNPNEVKLSAARKKSADMRKQINLWYEQKLSEVNTNPVRALRMAVASKREENLQCICGGDDPLSEKRETVDCSVCGRIQHASCIGAKRKKYGRPICCPNCWPKQELVLSKATLIVSPASISRQWFNEVQNHISKNMGFKLLVYNGVRADGYKQPYEFAKYDLILTTYEILRSELDLADPPNRRNLRYQQRYFTPTCPLLSVEFWRVCLDEAQMVEGTTSKAAEIVSRLFCIHRWAVTGTPIQKSIQDLYGLVTFLKIEPYSYFKSWKDELYDPYCLGVKGPLQTLFAHIMWRTSKDDVLDQIKIPPQTEQITWLNFSPVEQHYYQRTHSECSADFFERLLRFGNLHVTLDSLKTAEVSSVLAPLLKLRQACSHPQAVHRTWINLHKGAMTMTELLENLIKKTKLEGEECLRLHVSALNGMAAIHIICNEFYAAVDTYRKVLQIAEEYKDRFHVDTLQKLHTMHNLWEVLSEHRDKVPPTLRDDRLLEESKELENKYLAKAESSVTAVKKALSELSASVKKAEDELDDINEEDWWCDLCDTLASLDENELCNRIHTELLNNDKSLAELAASSIINKVSTHFGIKSELCRWFENLDKSRKEALKSLRSLQLQDADALVAKGVECHLRLSTLKNKKAKCDVCDLCTCESYLLKYEACLFHIKRKKSENTMIGDLLLLGQTREGSWKPSEQERILKVLISYGKGRKVNRNWISAGTTTIKLMNAMRKEFKHLRMLWSRINERTCARDELNMCKLRIRLRYPEESISPSKPTGSQRRKQQQSKLLSSNIDTTTENKHIIEANKVESMSLAFKSEAQLSLSDVGNKDRTLTYLENLRKKGNGENENSNPEICPVCQSPLGKEWTVLSCGHCHCMDCLPQLMGARDTQCPLCRQKTKNVDISLVNMFEDKPSEEMAYSTNISIPKVQGSHSTKVEGVIRRLFYLRAVDPSVKVLIFSTWDRVLDVLDQALSENQVQHIRLKRGKQFHDSLQLFKDFNCEDPVTALLLPLQLGSKGLNLTEATHVMLVEPILNPAEELQAIGRVHRIGQTRPTVVHRFLIRDTIEERMFSAVQATGAEQWKGDRVTLQRFKDLFQADSNATPSTSNAAVEPSLAEVNSVPSSSMSARNGESSQEELPNSSHSSREVSVSDSSSEESFANGPADNDYGYLGAVKPSRLVPMNNVSEGEDSDSVASISD